MLATLQALWFKATERDGELDLKYAREAAELAKDAAPFCHPRLANIDMKQSGNVTVKKVVYVVDDKGRVVSQVPAGEARVEEEPAKPALPASPEDAGST